MPLNHRYPGPRLTLSSWPTPMTDEHWAGRLRLGGKQLQAAWGMWIGLVQWEIFASLTFDEKRIGGVSRELADREVFAWLGCVAYLYRQPATWVYVVERGRGGHWHAHALIVGVRAPSWSAPVEVWRERNGIADVRPVSDVPGVALYSTKSTALDGEVVLSDTLRLDHFKSRLASGPVVTLYP